MEESKLPVPKDNKQINLPKYKIAPKAGRRGGSLKQINCDLGEETNERNANVCGWFSSTTCSPPLFGGPETPEC